MLTKNIPCTVENLVTIKHPAELLVLDSLTFLLPLSNGCVIQSLVALAVLPDPRSLDGDLVHVDDTLGDLDVEAVVVGLHGARPALVGVSWEQSGDSVLRRKKNPAVLGRNGDILDLQLVQRQTIRGNI